LHRHAALARAARARTRRDRRGGARPVPRETQSRVQRLSDARSRARGGPSAVRHVRQGALAARRRESSRLIDRRPRFVASRSEVPCLHPVGAQDAPTSHGAIMRTEALPSMPAAATSARVVSVDLLRGLIMIVMALDHVRDYFSPFPWDPTDLSK